MALRLKAFRRVQGSNQPSFSSPGEEKMISMVYNLTVLTINKRSCFSIITVTECGYKMQLDVLKISLKLSFYLPFVFVLLAKSLRNTLFIGYKKFLKMCISPGPKHSVKVY